MRVSLTTSQPVVVRSEPSRTSEHPLSRQTFSSSSVGSKQEERHPGRVTSGSLPVAMARGPSLPREDYERAFMTPMRSLLPTVSTSASSLAAQVINILQSNATRRTPISTIGLQSAKTARRARAKRHPRSRSLAFSSLWVSRRNLSIRPPQLVLRPVKRSVSAKSRDT